MATKGLSIWRPEQLRYVQVDVSAATPREATLDLAAEWKRDVGGLPGAALDKEAALQDILGAYSEPQRRYHGVGHLHALFRLFADYAPDAPLASRLAVWWHDVVYQPMSPDNEARSAALARTRLERLGAAPSLIDEVEALILASKDHWSGPSYGKSDAFLDADIAILGAPPAIYDQYARDVRAEYSAAPDQAYRLGRGKFLQNAMTRTPMFRTSVFENAFGDAARENMHREFNGLQSLQA